MGAGDIPKRPLGRTGVEVTAIGLGGAHLGMVPDEALAIRLVQEAIDGGITFLDNAWEYSSGRAEERMGRALQGRRDRVFLMSKVCTHGRGQDVAMRQLEESLRRLRTDHLDLWQVHECVYPSDPERHYASGVLDALDEAKRQGKVRFVGFTGHKDPSIHLDMLRRGYPFDSCQLPLNPFDHSFRSFERLVLPELSTRGIAAIGMKPLSGDGAPVREGLFTAKEGLRYAMSLDVVTTVTGIDSEETLRQALEVARGFTPMTPDERDELRRRCARHAADGRFELFKSSMSYDANPGREQHGFPSMEEMGG
jgi:uncharacterized protein